MSEISINTVENINKIDQIIFLTTFATKLDRHYTVTLHFLDFHKLPFSKSPLYYGQGGLLPTLNLTWAFNQDGAYLREWAC